MRLLTVTPVPNICIMLMETTHNFVMFVGLAHSILTALEKQSGTNLVIHDMSPYILLRKGNSDYKTQSVDT